MKGEGHSPFLLALLSFNKSLPRQFEACSGPDIHGKAIGAFSLGFFYTFSTERESCPEAVLAMSVALP